MRQEMIAMNATLKALDFKAFSLCGRNPIDRGLYAGVRFVVIYNRVAEVLLGREIP